MRRILALVAAGLVLATPVHGQYSQTAHPDTAGALSWGPAPPVFPAGAQMAVVSGDPSKAAPFTVQLSMPDGYKVPPHFHPTDEHVAVKKGTFLVGMGDALDVSRTNALKVGQSVDMPAQSHHYAVAKGATIVQVSAMGPFSMTYVNPADNPQPSQ